MTTHEINDDVFKTLYFKELIEYAKIDKATKDFSKLYKTLRQSCSLLDELGVNYWLSRGTMLGIHRDKKFLPNELDIDIDVYTDKDVYQIIKKLPYDVVVAATSESHYMQLAFLDRETGVVFDIWFYYPHGNNMINRNFFGYFLLPTNKIAPIGSVRFNGHIFPTFSDLDWYCQYWYGETWHTPRRYGSNWQFDYEKDCKAFIFKGEKNLSYKKYY